MPKVAWQEKKEAHTSLNWKKNFPFFMFRLHTEMLTTFYVSFTDVVSSTSSLSIHITTATLFLGIISLTSLAFLLQFFGIQKNGLNAKGEERFFLQHSRMKACGISPSDNLSDSTPFLNEIHHSFPLFWKKLFLFFILECLDDSYVCFCAAFFFKGISRMFVNRD